MKISYGLKNLRSLEVTPLLPLRPITILVGRNSAGKSTFLRSFSLLRQSLEARSSAPILWYGEYVDFGDFSAAVSYRDAKRDVSFCFEVSDFETRGPDEYMIFFDGFGYPRPGQRKIFYQKVKLLVSLGESAGKTIRRGIKLEVPEHAISLEVKFAKDGQQAEDYIVNGKELSNLLPNHTVFFSASNIFSAPALTISNRSESKLTKRAISPIHTFSAKISELLKPHVDKRINPENISVEARNILLQPKLNKGSIQKLMDGSNIRSFYKLYKKWADGEEDDTFHQINDIVSINTSLMALLRISDALKEFFISTTYLGPARARSERYYRFQELEVSEIAPDGQNLSIFLASLSDSEMDDFSTWVQKLFGFGVGVKKDVGHISIQLNRPDLSVNVADTGYGVSQMLPVLAQIWWAARSAMHRRISISTTPFRPITMEQPELHLHPAHQAKLADALLKAVKGDSPRRGPTPLFIVETHSEALINRLGELIEEGHMSQSEVQIVVFSADSSREGRTTVDTSEYNSEGVLQNWPYGFFNY